MSVIPTISPTTPRRTWRDRVARSIVQRVVRSRCERLVVDDDGDEQTLSDEAAPPAAGTVRVLVYEPATYRELLRHGSIGLAQSYVAGWWDSDDLVGVVQQDPYQEGQKAVEALDTLADGGKVEKAIKVPVTIVTKANVEQFRAAFK